jgi:hypothetical protein
VSKRPAQVVIRCAGRVRDGRRERTCGREQVFESNDDGVGVRVVTAVPVDDVQWLVYAGWRQRNHRWLCPSCAGEGIRS